jgi:proton-dependent oligopeptide transporter, POT family
MSASSDVVLGALSSPRARAGDWLGYPKGAWLIIGVEFWERFSFYGMLAILALFLTERPARGGFGWSAAAALSLVGIYSGAMYALPAFGGYLADRVIGRRRAVAIGGTFMLLGHILMGSPVFIPWWLGAWRHAPVLEALRALQVPLGQLPRSAAVSAAIAQQGAALDANAGATWLAQAYTLSASGLYLALLCLILGNAVMKSTLVVLCGDTFAADDPRRESAYAYYYQGIAIGSMLSGVVVGTVADRLGWHYGFGVAALGMSVAVGAYLLLGPRWLGDVGLLPERPAERATGARDRTSSPSVGEGDTQRRVILLLVLAILLCGFSAAWFQLFGSWSLFAEHLVDRSLGGFVVPVPWFASMNAAVVIALTPVWAAMLVRRGRRGRNPDIVQKYIFALGTAALGHLLMYGAAVTATPASPAPIWMPIVALALMAIGELVAWTATYGVVSRAAPAGLGAMTMGAWYLLTLGLGGYLAGFSGRAIDAFGYAMTFGGIAAAMALMAAAGVALRGRLLGLAARAGVSV